MAFSVEPDKRQWVLHAVDIELDCDHALPSRGPRGSAVRVLGTAG
ncbi:MAG: hypothetical protein QOJ06_678 [Pseudonocardiales bacterium]|jgi:hypothetical protein|nr:hypothetical protein [Pseudonocardiales bacterium]